MANPNIPGLPPRLDAQEPGQQLQTPTHHLQVSLDGMPVEQLLELRGEIDRKLPARALRDLDLEQELVIQLLATQQLQQKVLKDDDTPANQLAQVSNAVQTALQNLVKLQKEIYTAERLKRIESILIDTVREKLTTEQAEAFFAAYRGVLEALR